MAGVRTLDSMVAAYSEQLWRAAECLGSCRRLLVLAGAGTSAEAGVPTFRDEGGLWQNYSVEELASPEGFAANPDLVWDWYRERRLQVALAQPHEGQRTVALLQKHFPEPNRVLIATTNEDDLLERAGVSPVLHLHGSLFDTVCAEGCGWRSRDAIDNGLSFLDCPSCGGRVRPGSVWFGEPMPVGVMDVIARFNPDGCLVVGSSGVVQPAAAIPPELALAGNPVVEINPVPTPLSEVAAHHLQGTAKDFLPGLVDLLTSHAVRNKTTSRMRPIT